MAGILQPSSPSDTLYVSRTDCTPTSDIGRSTGAWINKKDKSCKGINLLTCSHDDLAGRLASLFFLNEQEGRTSTGELKRQKRKRFYRAMRGGEGGDKSENKERNEELVVHSTRLTMD